MTDIQTPIFSSYTKMNKFTFWFSVKTKALQLRPKYKQIKNNSLNMLYSILTSMIYRG